MASPGLKGPPPRANDSVERVHTPMRRGRIALGGGPFNPGLATVGLCTFYKVNSLAVATRISHKYSGAVGMMGHKN